jgi:REP element-mobilizing transposase RayT
MIATEKFQLHDFVIMPNHVHLLIAVTSDVDHRASIAEAPRREATAGVIVRRHLLTGGESARSISVVYAWTCHCV